LSWARHSLFGSETNASRNVFYDVLNEIYWSQDEADNSPPSKEKCCKFKARKRFRNTGKTKVARNLAPPACEKKAGVCPEPHMLRVLYKPATLTLPAVKNW
jgi:hypothetical protein